MAIISHKFNYLYLAAPATGSSTVCNYLLEHCDGSWIPESTILDHHGYCKLGRKHTTIPELIEAQLLTSEALESLFKFTTIRNPFDHLFAEWYRSRVKWSKQLENPDNWIHKSPGKAEKIQKTLNHDFSDWIKLRFGQDYKQGVKKHLHKSYKEGVDYVIKSENLDSDLKNVLKNLGVDTRAEIAAKNITPKKDKKPYWQYYDKEAREIVTSVLEPDLIKFGYTF